MSNNTPHCFVLRNLPLAPRFVITIFLISVGLGYFSALVQLHFQGASAGTHLPSADDAVGTYHGRNGISQIERLLITDESKAFNGSGSMRKAFTVKSGGWPGAIKQKARELKLDPKDPAALRHARSALYGERDGERQALLAWIRTEKGQQKAYDEDSFALPAALTGHPITPKYLDADTKTVKIQSILTDRCVRCHAEGEGSSAANFPLDTFERVKGYFEVEMAGGGMSLPKLAQTTHVHLLGFAMLYGLTGLIFSFTSYPAWMRFLIAPLPLVAQIADISCWWLARVDPIYAKAVVVTGGIVALGLGLQILLSLLNMFGRKGKIILVLLMLAAGLVARELDIRVIEPFLINERGAATSSETAGSAGD
jgi:hypothetical protein